MHCLIYQKNFDCVLYPDKDVLYQLCDTEDSLDEFQEQRYTKVPPRQSPQVTHTEADAFHTSCLRDRAGPKLQNIMYKQGAD